MLTKKKQLLYQKQAEIVKAIAHPLRIAIIDFLQTGPQCVCDIAKHIHSEQSNVSRHLSVMVSAGILDYQKDGLKVIYNLKTPCILNFFSCVTKCLQQQVKEQQAMLKAV
ncbi:MAG: metalloregulator ArsR/SmtB family transcription factor [Phycisphaerales bacterium]